MPSPTLGGDHSSTAALVLITASALPPGCPGTPNTGKAKYLKFLSLHFGVLTSCRPVGMPTGVLGDGEDFKTLAAIAIHFPLFLLLGAIVLLCQILN